MSKKLSETGKNPKNSPKEEKMSPKNPKRQNHCYLLATLHTTRTFTREGPCFTVPKASLPPRQEYLPCSRSAAPLHNASLLTKGCKKRPKQATVSNQESKKGKNVQEKVRNRQKCQPNNPQNQKCSKPMPNNSRNVSKRKYGYAIVQNRQKYQKIIQKRQKCPKPTPKKSRSLSKRQNC